MGRRKKQPLLQQLGAIVGGLVLALTLCLALPLAHLQHWWRRSRRRRPELDGPPLPDGAAAAAASKHPGAAAAALPHAVTIDVHAGAAHLPPPSQPPFVVTTDPDLLLPLFYAHGAGALHYASVANEEFRHFLCPALGGALAFVVAPVPHLLPGSALPPLAATGRKAVMAVGDPLAPRQSWGEIGRAFLRAFPGAFFGYASAEFANSLLLLSPPSPDQPHRLHANDWGLSTRILPPNEGGPSADAPAGRRSARQEARRARKSGLRVRELPLLELLSGGGGGDNDTSAEKTRAALREVSAQWLSTKVTRDRELRVFCRRLDFLDDDQALVRDAAAGTRLLVAEEAAAPPAGEEQAVVAFCVLDPQYQDERVVGWVLASTRALPTAHRGAIKLLQQAAATAAAPQPLELGLAPFAGLAAIEACPFGGGAPWMRLAARFLYSCADGRLYSFRGLWAAKQQYGPHRGGGGGSGSGSFSSGSGGGGSSNNSGSARGGGGGEHSPLFCVHAGGGGWLPSLTFVADLYAMMVFVGFCGDGRVSDTLLRLWGLRR